MQILLSDGIQNIDKLECRNWRDPFSFWGKWCKLVYHRNRLELRAKLMNLWRNNRYDIQSQVKKVFHASTLTLPISITISNLPHKFSSQFESISSSEVSKIPKISLDNEVIELEKDNYSKSIREFESSSLDLPTNVNSDSMNLDLLDDVEEIIRGEFELSRKEWDVIFPKCSKNTLKPEWTNIFNENIAMYYPICVIKFLYNRINKRYMVRNCPFLVAAATCKFSNCFSFKFVMETPETFENKGLRIKYVVTGSI